MINFKIHIIAINYHSIRGTTHKNWSGLTDKHAVYIIMYSWQSTSLGDKHRFVVIHLSIKK